MTVAPMPGPGSPVPPLEIPGLGSLEALSRERPVLLLFLRHLG